MFLYIDPGTGSMLFTIVIAIVSALAFAFQKLKLKLSFLLHGGKTDAVETNKYPYVLFSDNKQYWNVFKPICDEFEKRGIDVQYWTASDKDPALKTSYKHIHSSFIGEGNKAFAKLNMMKANICLSTTPGLDVYQWKRSPNTDYYVHTLHEVGGVTDYRMFGIDYYDSILLSGSFQEDYLRRLEKMRNLPAKDVCVCGAPFMDSKLERVSSLPSATSTSPVVLLAPTWGPNSLVNKFGEKFIDSLISTGYKIIFRPHPQMATSESELLAHLQTKYPSSEMFEWNFDSDNLAVLSRADIMITDISGVIFDYAFLFERPIIYADTKLDFSVYDTCWFKNELSWREKVLPILGRKLDESEFSNMKQIISDMIGSKQDHSARLNVRSEAWQFMGEGSKRTVDYLVSKYKEIAGC